MLLIRYRIHLLCLHGALIFSLFGCGDSSSGEYSDAPLIDFECSFVDAIGCDPSQVHKPVYVGLAEDLDLICAQKFSLSTTGDQIAQSFDYSSRTYTSEQGGVIVGATIHWANSSLMPVILLPSQTFKVCAFIDINENERIDANEPIHESTITIGEPFLPLSDWSNY